LNQLGDVVVSSRRVDSSDKSVTIACPGVEKGFLILICEGIRRTYDRRGASRSGFHEKAVSCRPESDLHNEWARCPPHGVLYDVSICSGTYALKLMAISLCIPCFEPAYFFFKVALTSRQIELLRLDRSAHDWAVMGSLWAVSPPPDSAPR